MSSSNPSELFEIHPFEEQPIAPEKRKKGTHSAPYSRRRIGILSVLFTPIVGALMLADNYEQLEDRTAANRLRFYFLVGVPLCWFLFSMVSVYFYTSTVLAISALLAWFLPILALDIFYRHWRKEWIEAHGEIVSGYGTKKVGLYVIVAIVITFGFRVFISPIGSAIVVSFLSSAAPTTFEDGSFSITYPSSWQSSETTGNFGCVLMECVQTFTLPSSRGFIVLNRTDSTEMILQTLQSLGDISLSRIRTPSMSFNRTNDIRLDGYDAIQYNYTINEPSSVLLKGILLVANTQTEIYEIVGISLPEDFYLIEQALGTIQLDLVSDRPV